MRHLLIPLLTIALLLIGCERKESSSATPTTSRPAAPAGKKLTVAMLPKKKGIPYFTTCADGAQTCAKELGNVELIYDGPTDGSAEKQAGMIETWTLQGIDVIAVSP